MKRHKPLFEQVCSLENLHLAYLKARRGKRDRPAVEAFSFHLERELLRLRDELRSGGYRPGPYRQFVVYEAKRRLISAAPFRDRVAHHAVCNVIEPVFEPTFIHDSYACRLGKGQHAALRRLREFLQSSRYVLKGDVVRFFPSIDHGILLELLARKIGDGRLLELLAVILSHAPPESEGGPYWFPGDDLFAPLRPRGLPIGNQTSQFFANVYLNPFDHFVKEALGCRHYLRYADDFVILDADKGRLHEVRAAVRERLAGLRLRLHPDKTQVFPATQGTDWLGYRVFPTHVRVRKGNVHRFKRRLRRMQEAFARGEMDASEVGRRVQSWLAHAAHADSRQLRHDLLARTMFSRAV